MNYTLTIRQNDYEVLQAIVFSTAKVEGAAYLLCGESRSGDEIRLLAREVIPIVPEHYLAREPDFLSISSMSYVSIAKRARSEQISVVFVHSHPGGFLEFSQQDDREEKKLQDFLNARIPNRIHGALLLTETGVVGRVYDRGFQPMTRIRIIGKRFAFHDRHDTYIPNMDCFDRQVRAFGPEAQGLLHRLHAGVVGAGGTGSAVIEQLARLGVGTLSVFDGDKLESSNVNRVYGSAVSHSGELKAIVAQKNVERMGLGTQVRTFSEPITKEEIAKQLRACDVIYGCTDKQIPRSILIQLSLRYLIPVIDMGVLISSRNSIISDVIGRITVLLPGEACLFCRKRITAEGIRLESLAESERISLAQEGYAPELGEPNPAVIAFTTAVASLAVSELLHRLTGYMGSDRISSEVLCFFDQTQLRTNRVPPGEQCLCSQQKYWAQGDSVPFLDTSWVN